LILETNETALQSQQQILEENEERVKKIRQETGKRGLGESAD